MSAAFFKNWNDVPASAWHWNNFSPAEIACRGTGELLVHAPSLDLLQKLRIILGRPVILNSAYRSEIHNARVGGAPLSMHRMGRAFDISLSGQDRDFIRTIALKVGFSGIGRYQTFLHVDTGRTREWGYA